MQIKSFEKYLEQADGAAGAPNKDWRKSFIKLEKGFIPPSKMRPVVEAFQESGNIELTTDTAKAPTMPKKTLYLVGGPVRDFLRGSSIKDYDLATNATPEQVAHILSNAGFKWSGDKSGKPGKPLGLTFDPPKAQNYDKKTWFIKGRDASKDGKAFVIGAVVDGEVFDIATFRKDAKVTDGAAEVDFVDNPHEDASRRDLTINALYIELSKADGENDKLYDPTGKGWHDVKNSVVRTVGKAEERFAEDKLRVLRAIRFHARFGDSMTMDKDIEQAIPKFRHLDGVALERIRDEFVKGLTDPNVDAKKYITIYKRTGLLNKVFPGVNFDPPNSVPMDISDKKDRSLALAWLLQHNPIEKVAEALNPSRRVGSEDKMTGWQIQERKAVLFLLKLKEFSADKVVDFMQMRQGTGLSVQQIREWVEMFKIQNTNRHRRPWWAKEVHAFADHERTASWDDAVNAGHDVCPSCRGGGCEACKGSGKLPENMRSGVLKNIETKNFQSKIK